MSIKKIIKRIIKPVVTEIVEELLQDKVHESVLYKVHDEEIEIVKISDGFITDVLKERLKRNLKTL